MGGWRRKRVAYPRTAFDGNTIANSVTFLFAYFLELAVVKVGVESIQSHKLIVITLLNNIAFVHTKYKVCVAYCRKAVGDNEACSAFHKVIHSTLNQYFGTCVN